MDDVIIKLDQLVSAIKAASIPADSRWLDAEGVGAMLGFAPRYVLESLSRRSDFPKPLRVDGTGHPRWLASEVSAWAEANRERFSPRQRGKR